MTSATKINYTNANNKSNLSFEDVFKIMQNEPSKFHSFIKQIIGKTGYDAVYIEFPRLDKNNIRDTFEFVVIPGAELKQLQPNPGAFNLSDDLSNDLALSIQNKSNDAILIIPNLKSKNNYAHLYNFLDPRNLQPVEDKVYAEFWKKTAIAIETQLPIYGNIWISTSGMGIPWLHLRISNNPKYYKYRQYTT